MLQPLSRHHDQLRDQVSRARINRLPLTLLERSIILVLAIACGRVERGRGSSGIIRLGLSSGGQLGHVEQLVRVRHRHVVVFRLQLKVIWLEEHIVFRLIKHV